MATVRLLAPALLALLTSSCVILEGGKVTVEHPEEQTLTGLVVQDTFSGEGPGAAEGDLVRLDYIALTEEGTVIDSTYERGHPIEFTVGSAPLAGLDEGVLGLAVGGKRRLVIPPELAYGADGVPGIIPPEATLEFLVELVEVSTPSPSAN